MFTLRSLSRIRFNNRLYRVQFIQCWHSTVDKKNITNASDIYSPSSIINKTLLYHKSYDTDPCKYCTGTGLIPCNDCDGFGRAYWDGCKEFMCDGCHGTGCQECKICGGGGYCCSFY